MRVKPKCLGQEERGWADQNHSWMVHRADKMLLSAFSVDRSAILIPSHGIFSLFLFFLLFLSQPSPSCLPLSVSLSLSSEVLSYQDPGKGS